MIDVKIIKLLLEPEYRANILVNYCGITKDREFIKKLIIKYLKRRFHICIGMSTNIAGELFLPHPQNIVIGNGVKIGNRVVIYHDVTIGVKSRSNTDVSTAYAEIGNDVCIYAGAKVIGNIKVEDGCIIGCNAVVNCDTVTNGVYAGIPARQIGN